MRIFALLLVLTFPAFASDWLEIRSPNFIVRTDAGDRRGREIALRFEQMRRVFGTLLPRKLKVTAPLIVVAFRNNVELKQVAPVWKGKPVELSGFYLKGEDRSYIALDASVEDAWQSVFHEYAHFLMNINFPPTPLWWDEGFAGYYSTISVDKKQYVIGQPPDAYRSLLQQGMMPLDKLFAVTQNTSEYNETGHPRSQFYAQSWLFVAYIFDRGLLEQTTNLFSLLKNQSMPAKEAVQLSYGKTLKELDDGLKNYLAGDSPQLNRIAVPAGQESIAYDMERLPDLKVQATIADLHLHSPDHQQTAEQEFRKILEKSPRYAEAHTGLGYALMRRQDFDGATTQFQQSASLGSTDPHVFYFAAYNLYKKAPDSKENLVEIGRYLDRAIQLEEHYGEAYNLKAIIVGKAANTAEAIRLLRKAVEIEPRRDDYKLNLTYQLLVARHFDEAEPMLNVLASNQDPAIAEGAKQQLATAKKWKSSPLLQMAEQTDQSKYASAQWSRKADDRSDPEADSLQTAQANDRELDPRPIKSVKATLLASACTAAETVIRARVGTTVHTVHAAAAKQIAMVGSEPFNCAWKNRAATINYQERSSDEWDLFSLDVPSTPQTPQKPRSRTRK